MPESSGGNDQWNDRSPGPDSGKEKDDDKDDKEKKSFGEWFSGGGWMWFAGGAALLGLGYIGYRTLKKPKAAPKAKSQPSLSGPGKSKKKRRRRRKPSSKRPTPTGNRPPRRGGSRPGPTHYPRLPVSSRRPTLQGILDGPAKSRTKKKTKATRKRKSSAKKSGKRKAVNLN